MKTISKRIPPIRKTTRMAKKGRHPVCGTENQSGRPSNEKRATTHAQPKRCMRPGPLQRNPYLNFLRDYRKNCCGLSAIETIRRGAQEWKTLTTEQKVHYIVQAFYTRQRKKRLRNLCCSGGHQARKSIRSTRTRKPKRAYSTRRK